ncbi:DUF4179 domain-containing protein [Paucisalibacillus globulus]|uniref:DUF4179 domain-containing protein n=1 Tax=Paucisalibacillus globulus TaxID=351095 RepID=UPI0004273474|nr:DUF4179 domain-containing protein [Paucisalibacillus globulus]
MEKLRHEISRMVDDVPVPNQKLDDTVQTALIKAKKQEKRSFFKKQNLIATIASVFVVAFGILLLNTDQETASGDIGNTSILYQQGDVGLQRMVTEGNTQEIGMEVENQGYKVILEEGYIDNHQMAISVRMETEDTIEPLPELTEFTYEFFVDGKPQGKGIIFYHTKELITNGDTITFGYPEKIEPDSELALQITEINGVEGDWGFSLNLDKQTEFIVLKDIPSKEDDLGNSFVVRYVEMTPTTLKINANTDVLVDYTVNGSKDFSFEVIGISKDGEMFLSDSISISSYLDPEVNTTRLERYYDVIEVPRGVNVYSYKIIPYIVTHQGVEVKHEHGEGFKANEHTTPFKEGEIIGSNSEFKVENIKQEKDATIVTYETNTLIPSFPTIINREKDEYINVVSFKNNGDKVEVTYPKVEVDKKTKFLLYEASYQVFPELETQIDLK